MLSDNGFEAPWPKRKTGMGPAVFYVGSWVSGHRQATSVPHLLQGGDTLILTSKCVVS